MSYVLHSTDKNTYYDETSTRNTAGDVEGNLPTTADADDRSEYDSRISIVGRHCCTLCWTEVVLLHPGAEDDDMKSISGAYYCGLLRQQQRDRSHAGRTALPLLAGTTCASVCCPRCTQEIICSCQCGTAADGSCGAALPFSNTSSLKDSDGGGGISTTARLVPSGSNTSNGRMQCPCRGECPLCPSRTCASKIVMGYSPLLAAVKDDSAVAEVCREAARQAPRLSRVVGRTATMRTQAVGCLIPPGKGDPAATLVGISSHHPVHQPQCSTPLLTDGLGRIVETTGYVSTAEKLTRPLLAPEATSMAAGSLHLQPMVYHRHNGKPPAIASSPNTTNATNGGCSAAADDCWGSRRRITVQQPTAHHYHSALRAVDHQQMAGDDIWHCTSTSSGQTLQPIGCSSAGGSCISERLADYCFCRSTSGIGRPGRAEPRPLKRDWRYDECHHSEGQAAAKALCRPSEQPVLLQQQPFNFLEIPSDEHLIGAVDAVEGAEYFQRRCDDESDLAASAIWHGVPASHGVTPSRCWGLTCPVSSVLHDCGSTQTSHQQGQPSLLLYADDLPRTPDLWAPLF